MSNGLGFLGPARLEQFREENADILEGPSPDAVRASRSTATSGLGLAEAGFPRAVQHARSGRLFPAIGETVRGVATLPAQAASVLTSGQTLGEQRAVLRQQAQIQARRENIKALVDGMTVLQPIASSIISAPADKQQALIDSAVPEVEAAFGPLGVIALDNMVRNESLAAIDRQQFFTLATQDPQAAGVFLRTNGDLTEASPEEVERIFEGVAKRQVDENLGQARSLLNEVNKVYERQHPDQKAEPGQNITQSEMLRRLSDPAVQDQVPATRDPGIFRLARTGVTLLPDRFGLARDETAEKLELEEGKARIETAEKLELEEGKARIKARFREPKEPRRAEVRNVRLPSGETVIGEVTEQGVMVPDETGRLVPAPRGSQLFGTQVTGAEVRNVRLPSGETVIGEVTEQGVMVPDETGRLVPAPRGSQLFGTQVTGAESDVFPESEKAATEALDESASLAQARGLLRQLEEIGPGGVGFFGAAASNVGGILGQINETLGDVTARTITGGASLEQLQEFEQGARSLVGQAVRTFRIEESGRITDMERRLSEQALALVAPGKNFEQVKAGLVAFLKLSIVNQDRKIIESGGQPAPLETDEQKIAQLRRYKRLGMNDAQAADTLRSVIDMREEIEVVRRGR